MMKLVCTNCGVERYSSVGGWMCDQCGKELKEVLVSEKKEIRCPRCRTRLISAKQSHCHECGGVLD